MSVLYDFALRERGESNKTNANKISYEASYEAPLTKKTRLKTSLHEIKKYAKMCPDI